MITLSNFSDPLIDRIERRCRSWTATTVRSVTSFHSSEYSRHTHQSTESFECSGNTDTWVDFNEDTASRVDVDLQFPTLVQRRIKQGKKALFNRNKSTSSVLSPSPELLCSSGFQKKSSNPSTHTHLVSNIRPSMGNISPHLRQHTLMIITIQQTILVFSLPSLRTRRS